MQKEEQKNLSSKTVFELTLNMILKKRYIILLLAVAIVLQLFMQYGKYRYLDNIKNVETAKEVEKTKVSNYKLYRQYSGFGITMIFLPSPFSVLYNNYIYEELSANVNAAETLNIYKPLKGEGYFIEKTGYLNFMGIVFILGIFLALIYGVDSTENKRKFKFLSSLSEPKRIFWAVVFSRFVVLSIISTLLILISIVPLLFNNINLFGFAIIPITLGVILVLTIFFSIGCIIGQLKNKYIRAVILGVVYFFFVIIMPLITNIFLKVKSSDIERLLEFDLYNMKLVQSVEKRLIDKYGVQKPGDKSRPEIIRAIEAELNKAVENEYKEIRDREAARKNKVLKKIRDSQTLYALIPTLFYISICEEVSTHGGLSFVDFYSFSEDNKKRFTEFCFKKLYSGQNLPDTGKVENFFKNDDDGYFSAKSKLPHNFFLGVIISCIWIVLLLFIAYRIFLKQMAGEPGEIRDFDVDMKSDEFNYLLTADEGLKNQVYSYLSGDREIHIELTLDGEKLEPGDFIYVYEQEKFQKDVDKKTLYKRLFSKKMTGDKKVWQFLIHYAVESEKILLLDKFFNGMKINEVKKIIDEIVRSGVKALYIGDNIYEAEKLTGNLIFSLDDMSVEGIKEVIEEINNH